MWLSPSGQVAHTTLDWRLCRTRIFRKEEDAYLLYKNASFDLKKYTDTL